ncbi:ABC transporter ATP-binding protein [Halobacteriovorax sp. GB3]|uniref:ATP-binding cassette domain-containing protein n=1 Tax=Halobacteriovorax sp. GB3 TaxID=2719615 RepID=UPI002360ED08|nr:ABC transporter ATP-binding protein [Halobacteriovorax sp. GB3]MDD0853655.1 ABC transporter ATP-binding protein [Halobacteriovorax sp. GB3]
MNISKIRWSEFFFFEGGKKYFSVILVCLLGSSALGALVPRLMAELSRTYGDTSEYYNSIELLLFLFIGVYLNRSLYQLFVNKYVRELVQETRTKCYQKWLLNYDIQTEDKTQAERYPQGEVLARIMNDTESLRELITSGTFGIFIDLFFVLSCLVSFISLNLYSGSFLAISEVVASVILIYGSKYMRSVFLSVRQARGNLSKTVANLVGGLQESYFTRHENYASKKGERVFDDFLFKQLKANIWDASYYSVAESLYPMLLALVVFIFPYSKIAEAAIVFAIVDLIQRSIGPVKDIASKIANVQRAASGMMRMSEFLNDLDDGHSSPLESNGEKANLCSFSVDIDRYQYPLRSKDSTPFALKDIHFKASRGELIGIVGLSGSGKSTLLNILAANIIPGQANLLLSCQSGVEIKFPGDSIDDVTRYREQVGIVSQDSHIFTESVFFNISMREGSPSEEFTKFWDWIKESIPYISHWGIGPETVIRPKDLSMGQKQLIAAIRSCYLKKPIVLFDEVSSGLDGDLELALRKVVLLIQENSLTFIVAHRIETIIESNRILVMDQGLLIAEGTHQELNQSNDVYRQFISELSHY